MKFKLRQLEAFQAVAKTGSVTLAAQALNVSQPAVSRLLSDFSKTVTVELFVREGGRLVPTSEARYLLSEVGRVFKSLEHLEELNRDLSERKAGHLRIACLPGFATSHLPSVLVDFLNARPGVTATLEPDRPEHILDWIVRQQFDCGITDGFTGHPAVESQDVNIRTVCVLPAGHPLAKLRVITPLDLEHENIIHTRRDSTFFSQLSKSFAEYGVLLNSWIEVRQFNTACAIISQGRGVSIVSALDADAFGAEGLVVREFEPETPHQLSILKPMAGSQSLLMLDFIEVFLESLEPYLMESRPYQKIRTGEVQLGEISGKTAIRR